jgi:regulator of protease activity HflC (stomatin/prohibitin superfamily)
MGVEIKMVNLLLFGLLNPIVIAVILIVLASLKVVKEYERGVRFTLGKYTGMMKPGLRMVIPVIQSWERVDLRVKAVDVPDQDCITKDNVSVRVNAVLYFKVAEAEKAIIGVENYFYATSQLSQTTMRDIVGEVTLDELLRERDEISKKIKMIVDKATDPWGIKVESVDLKHVELPDNMKRTMAKEAESEREKRAVIIKAEGEVMAANNMSKAATMLAKAPGALHLRTLQSINDMSSDQSNTIVFAVPLEILKSFEGFAKK